MPSLEPLPHHDNHHDDKPSLDARKTIQMTRRGFLASALCAIAPKPNLATLLRNEALTMANLTLDTIIDRLAVFPHGQKLVQHLRTIADPAAIRIECQLNYSEDRQHCIDDEDDADDQSDPALDAIIDALHDDCGFYDLSYHIGHSHVDGMWREVDGSPANRQVAEDRLSQPMRHTKIAMTYEHDAISITSYFRYTRITDNTPCWDLMLDINTKGSTPAWWGNLTTRYAGPVPIEPMDVINDIKHTLQPSCIQDIHAAVTAVIHAHADCIEQRYHAQSIDLPAAVSTMQIDLQQRLDNIAEQHAAPFLKLMQLELSPELNRAIEEIHDAHPHHCTSPRYAMRYMQDVYPQYQDPGLVRAMLESKIQGAVMAKARHYKQLRKIPRIISDALRQSIIHALTPLSMAGVDITDALLDEILTAIQISYTAMPSAPGDILMDGLISSLEQALGSIMQQLPYDQIVKIPMEQVVSSHQPHQAETAPLTQVTYPDGAHPSEPL